jgi:sigma-E factor negative regulatory protein RseA
MNAAQDPKTHPLQGAMNSTSLSPRPEPDGASALSALVDGELDALEFEALLLRSAEDGATQAAWHRYQVIGEVLRGSAPAVSAVAAPDFLAGVRARLESEPLVRPRPASAVVPPQVRAPAANDAVFRWKLLAGAASLAAVMAVSWSVLSGAPAGAGGSAGPQLALMQPAPEAAGNLPSAVLVSTPQGPVIRDARLEQLLAEHRQYGGMSALQMPAGFLRDATFDAAPPR